MFFLAPRVIDIRQASGLVFFILSRASRRGVPMDADEPLLLNLSEKKFARAAEGRREFARIQERVLYVRARRAFPEAALRSLRIFNQRKFEYEIRVVFVRRFLSVRMKTTATRRLGTPERVLSTERQIQSPPLNYTECPLQYGKKEGDNSLRGLTRTFLNHAGDTFHSCCAGWRCSS